MPLSNYDAMFGGKTGAAAEVHAAMVKRYGKNADRVFYALMNKRRKKHRPTMTAQHAAALMSRRRG